MMTRYYLNAVMVTVLLSFALVLFVHARTHSETAAENGAPMNIRHGQFINFTGGTLISDEQKGIASGDLRWEATGYRYGGTGSINSRFMVSMHPSKYVTVSRVKKIENADFASISRATCKEIQYDETDVISRVNDNDVFCIASDKNRDGQYGDEYVKLKIISHKDSDSSNYADSVTLMYEVL